MLVHGSETFNQVPTPATTAPVAPARTSAFSHLVAPRSRTRAPARAAAPARTGLRPLLSANIGVSYSQLTSAFGGSLGISVAPLGRGPIQLLGSLTSGHAWSTMKVPVLVTLLSERGGQPGLSSQEATWARLALTQSNNQAAIGLFSALEQSHHGLFGASAAVQQTLRHAGDNATEVNTAPNTAGFTTFGQTLWSADASTRFYRALARGCLLSMTDTEYVLGLMSEVTGDQRWGMGQADLGGVPLSFKGGWGPENGGPYIVRQTVIVGSGNHGYVASILAQSTSAGSSSFQQATGIATQATRWIAEHLSPRAARPVAACP